MNIKKLNELVNNSKLNKMQIAERCGISRTTLDNVLAGADSKISTIESLANVLCVSVGLLFDENYIPMYNKQNDNLIKSTDLDVLRAEILLLQGENRVLREQLGLPARKETATRTA